MDPEEIVAFTEVFRCKVEVYFKESHEKHPMAFGSGNVVSHILCSGGFDSGHYDALLPMSSQAIRLEFYKEPINLMEYGDHMKDQLDKELFCLIRDEFLT